MPEVLTLTVRVVGVTGPCATALIQFAVPQLGPAFTEVATVKLTGGPVVESCTTCAAG